MKQLRLRAIKELTPRHTDSKWSPLSNQGGLALKSGFLTSCPCCFSLFKSPRWVKPYLRHWKYKDKEMYVLNPIWTHISSQKIQEWPRSLHMKRYSASLGARKIQIKTTMKYHYMSSGMVKFFLKLMTSNVGEDIGQPELSYVGGGIQNGANTVEKSDNFL